MFVSQAPQLDVSLSELTEALEPRRADVVEHVAATLDELALVNDDLQHEDGDARTSFHSVKAPAVGVRDYVRRLGRLCQPGGEEDEGRDGSHVPAICFALALVYMDRLATAESRLYATSLTAHRLFLGSLLVAIKSVEEGPAAGAPWEAFLQRLSLAAGVAIPELRLLEHATLQGLDKTTYASQQDIIRYLKGMPPPAGMLLENNSGAQGGFGNGRGRLDQRFEGPELPPPYQ